MAIAFWKQRRTKFGDTETPPFTAEMLGYPNHSNSLPSPLSSVSSSKRDSEELHRNAYVQKSWRDHSPVRNDSDTDTHHSDVERSHRDGERNNHTTSPFSNSNAPTAIEEARSAFPHSICPRCHNQSVIVDSTGFKRYYPYAECICATWFSRSVSTIRRDSDESHQRPYIANSWRERSPVRNDSDADTRHSEGERMHGDRNNSISPPSNSSRHASQEGAKAGSRNPTCARCRNHGEIVPLKGHKRYCAYAECICEGCQLVVKRQQIMAQQVRNRRAQEQDRVMGRKPTVCRTVKPEPWMPIPTVPPETFLALSGGGNYLRYY